MYRCTTALLALALVELYFETDSEPKEPENSIICANTKCRESLMATKEDLIPAGENMRLFSFSFFETVPRLYSHIKIILGATNVFGCAKIILSIRGN